MEEGEVGRAITDVCTVCKDNPAKYRCPGCDIQSCSLACVQEHKKVHSCSGKRPRAASQFMPTPKLTPEVLLDDYWLLEEATTLAQTLSKSTPDIRKRPRNQFLAKKCSERNIHLSLMPVEMTRARLNKTRMKADKLFWTIEWILLDRDLDDHPVNLTLDSLRHKTHATLYSQACEDDRLESSYRELLSSHPNSSLPNPDEVCLLLRQEADRDLQLISTSVTVPLGRRLWPVNSLETSWKLLLMGRTIIEFPTIYLFPKQP